ncbi:hypothetical protein [Commensalibacter oyaizuii]|uniref:Uncharacterized protein n=1 Tax=Commensalibacter oyaizuii TaxID=3043873 RepID=A0ABT6Q1G8_9PROT|nr:hypothetical protein [Commensalibacter sp. TBRC 16381]MDI2090945.1 hypothetical protein [Commensalibacter sp. TBRC 16381]
MILLSVCLALLIMFSIFFSLWDVLVGRWSKTERKREEQEDKERFDYE